MREGERRRGIHHGRLLPSAKKRDAGFETRPRTSNHECGPPLFSFAT